MEAHVPSPEARDYVKLFDDTPMIYILEKSGGLNTTGRERVMDIMPTVVHQRMSMIIGSRDDVQ